MRDLQTNSICLTNVNVTSALARYIKFFSRSLRRKLLGFSSLFAQKNFDHSLASYLSDDTQPYAWSGQEATPTAALPRELAPGTARHKWGFSLIKNILSCVLAIAAVNLSNPFVPLFLLTKKAQKKKLGKKKYAVRRVSRSAERDLGRCPKNPQTF